MNLSIISDNLDYLLGGLETTLLLVVCGAAGSMLIGMLGAVLRLHGGRLVGAVVKLYVDFFRTTPFLIQLIWIFFALPVLIGKSIPPFTAAVIGLCLYQGALFTEIFRAGILSLVRGQAEAGAALGMTQVQAYRRIILPQATVRMLPVIAQQLVMLIKESALASVIAVSELTYRSQTLGQQTLDPLPILTFALVVYMLIAYPVTVLANVAYRRLRA